MWSGEVVGAVTPFLSQNFWTVICHPLLIHHESKYPDFKPPPTSPGTPRQFPQSFHYHYQKFLQLAWDSSQESQNYLIKLRQPLSNHQQPEVTTSAGSGADMIVPELTCKGMDDIRLRISTNPF